MPDPAGVEFLQKTIERIIQISVGLAFVTMLVMLVIGAIKYLTSGGEAKGLSSAANTFTWALLGMLFLVIAWLILKLIENFTGVPVTKFCIGFPPFCLGPT